LSKRLIITNLEVSSLLLSFLIVLGSKEASIFDNFYRFLCFSENFIKKVTFINEIEACKEYEMVYFFSEIGYTI